MEKTFKDFLIEDLDVFFDLDEFADVHVLDREEIPLVVVDNINNDDMKGFSKQQLYASQEVYKKLKVIYVKSADYLLPKVDSVIELDGFEYYVEEAGDEAGVIRMVVSAHES